MVEKREQATWDDDRILEQKSKYERGMQISMMNPP